ncbi:MAG: divalent-cation tolerance protein CutA [Deltaproteobacteria bacterium]|nr:divalent-cation tolerance protein CutA [Deltaproteobacteria bacterium]
MSDFVIITTTTDQRKDAEKIARILIEKKLAACVQIAGPVTSIYPWKGKIETADEWQCVIKSRADLFGQIEAAIKSIHPYETPEIIAVPVDNGSKDYLDWMSAELINS